MTHMLISTCLAQYQVIKTSLTGSVYPPHANRYLPLHTKTCPDLGGGQGFFKLLKLFPTAAILPFDTKHLTDGVLGKNCFYKIISRHFHRWQHCIN